MIPFCITSAYAQTFTLSGQFVDEKNIPLSFIEIAIYKGDSLVLTEISDDNGKFEVFVKPSTYELTAESFGEILYKQNIEITQDTDLKDIKILNQSIILNEAVISGNNPIFKQEYDKLIFNVENSPLKQGYDGLEVLQRSPKIQINSKGNILLRNQSPLVMVNGRKMNLSGDELNAYLSSLNSENIKSIEIQTIGSAETEASNAGGVINIVLKKIPIGFQTTVRTYQIYRNKENQVYFGGITNQFGSEKWNIYNQINYTDNSDAYNYNSIFHFYENNGRNENVGQADSRSKNFNTRTGVVFYPNTKHEIGTEFYYSKNKTNNKGSEILNIFNPELSATSTNIDETKSNTDFWNIVLNYTYKLDSLGSNLKLIADIGNNDFENKNEVDTRYTFGNLQDNRFRYLSGSNSDFYNIQTDWNQKFSKNWELNAGVKFSNVSRKNELNTYLFNTDWQPATDGLQNFKNNESVLGSYLSASATFNEKHQIKIGLRAEYANIKGTDFVNNTEVEQDYLDWFPNLYYGYEIGNNQTLALSYSRRIDRPSFNNLNPFIIKQNDFLYQTGNPDLKPQYTNKLDLTYQLKNQSFSIYGNFIEDLISGVYTVGENNISYFKPQNFGKEIEVGLDYAYYGNITKWLYANLSSGIWHYNFKIEETKKNRVSFYLSTYMRFKLSNTFFVELYNNYYSKSQFEVSTGAEQYKMDIALQKNFRNAIVKLGLTDVFNTQRDKNTSYYDTFNFDFYQKRITRAVSLSFTYTFKNKTQIKNKNVQSDSDNKNRL